MAIEKYEEIFSPIQYYAKYSLVSNYGYKVMLLMDLNHIEI